MTGTNPGRRLVALLVGLCLLTIGTAGCFGKDRGSGDTDTEAAPETFGTYDLYVAPLDPPPDLEGAVLTIVVEHVAFLDSASETWVALLAGPVTVELVLEEGFGEEAWLTTVPVPAGDYSDVELVASSATLTTPDGEASTTVDDDTCYTPAPVTVEADQGSSLTLILDASAALSEEGGDWTFRPALTGSYGGDSAADGGADVGEPYCVSSGSA